MSRKVIETCNRCKIETDDQPIDWIEFIFRDYANSDKRTRIDLCAECKKDFVAYLQGGNLLDEAETQVDVDETILLAMIDAIRFVTANPSLPKNDYAEKCWIDDALEIWGKDIIEDMFLAEMGTLSWTIAVPIYEAAANAAARMAYAQLHGLQSVNWNDNLFEEEAAKQKQIEEKKDLEKGPRESNVMSRLPDGACGKCEGCGQVADTEKEEPWKHWEALPEESKISIKLGLVKPKLCPACGGTGTHKIEGQHIVLPKTEQRDETVIPYVALDKKPPTQ